MKATELGDAKLVAETLAEDVRFTMPPQPGLWVGRDEVVGGWVEGGFGDPTRIGDFRCIAHVRQPPAGGRQLPARAGRGDVPRVRDRRPDRRPRAGSSGSRPSTCRSSRPSGSRKRCELRRAGGRRPAGRRPALRRGGVARRARASCSAARSSYAASPGPRGASAGVLCCGSTASPCASCTIRGRNRRCCSPYRASRAGDAGSCVGRKIVSRSARKVRMRCIVACASRVLVAMPSGTPRASVRSL